MITKKISLFGPRDCVPKKNSIELIVDGLKNMNLTNIATGGVVGFPTKAVEQLQGNNILLDAYTPCLNLDEWVFYQEKGLAPSMELFNQYYWSENKGNIRQRSIQRILPLCSNSLANLAYLNGGGNTHLEVQTSLALEIPTYCLVDNQTDLKKWDSVYRQLSRDKRLFKIYSDPKKLIDSLGGELNDK